MLKIMKILKNLYLALAMGTAALCSAPDASAQPPGKQVVAKSTADMVLRHDVEARRSMRAALPRPAAKAPLREAAAGTTTLYGSVIDSYSETYYVGPGIYAYSPYDVSNFSCVAKDIRVYGGGTYGNGIYYAQDFTENRDGTLVLPVALHLYSPKDNWFLTETYYGMWWDNIACDLTYDYSQRTLYGVFWNEDYTSIDQFGYITFNDPQKGAFKANPISTMPERIAAITSSPDGTLYAFGRSGKMYTIDRATGEATVRGQAAPGEIVPFYQSACFDETTGHIFWHTIYNDWGDWGTFEVDPATASGTLVGDCGYDGSYNYDQVTGLTTLTDPTDVVCAPSPVSGLTVSVLGNAVTANVRFTMPSTAADGTSLNGTLLYNIYVDGKTAASAEAEAGKTVTAQVEFPDNGTHRVTVSAEKDGREGRVTVAEATNNTPAPMPPTDVKANVTESSDEESTVSISWNAPATDVNGAAIDAASLTYSVVRQPAGVEVYNGAALSCTDVTQHVVKQDIRYEVSAIYNGLASEPASSPTLTVGTAASAPYACDFTGDCSDWRIIDANNDGSTWTITSGQASYRYNAENAADDYLVLPPLTLEAGELYHFEVTAHNTSLVERLAAFVGTAPEAEALQTMLIKPTDITYDPRVHKLRGDFLPTTTGRYYFAVQCCSDADMSTVYVTHVSVTKTPGTAPAAPEAFTVTPGEKGALSATVDFDVPTKSINGQALSAVDYCLVRRDGSEVARLDGVSPGQHLQFTDTEGLRADTHTYTVSAVAKGVEGNTVSQNLYIGLDAPGPVQRLRACEDLDEPGTIVLTWEPPTEGQHGGYINPDDLVYFVSYGYSGDEVATYDRTYRHKLDISGGQTYQAFSVYAENNAGSGRYVWQTVVAIAGPPIEAPVVESFPGVTMNSGPWLPEIVIGNIGEAYWTPCDGSMLAEGSQDSDGGTLVFNSSKTGVASRIISPKISIASLSDPMLSFWAYYTGAKDSLKVELSADYSEYETLLKLPMDAETPGWHRHTCDLTGWKDKGFVRIAFQGVSVETRKSITAFDNFAIKEASGCDLQASLLEGPEKIKVGERGYFTLEVRNMGETPVDGNKYTVELYKDDKLCHTAKGRNIATDGTLSIMLSDVPTIDDNETCTYHAVVKAEGDVNTENDRSNEVSVGIILPHYPCPTALEGAWTGHSIRLDWQEPDLSTMPAQSTTDSFEDYPAFAIEGYGDWTTVDRDGARTIRIMLSDMLAPLDYLHAGEPMAFQVFSSLEAGIPFSSWDARTGDQMLVAFKCSSPDQGATEIYNDDWLISPALDGTAQTLSFYAKTGMGSPYVPESFEVWASSTTTDIDAFVKLGDTYDIDNVSGWQEIKVTLPEGSRHFAIRCVSQAKFALLIDDITYIPEGAAPEELSLTGYNVYRDGERMNEAPVDGNTWEDTTTALDETHSYRVTAVYDKGESLYSNAVSVQNTAVDKVDAGSLHIAAAEGCIEITGAEGRKLSVYTPDGRCRLAAQGRRQMSIPVTEGYYLVKVDGNPAVTLYVQ